MLKRLTLALASLALTALVASGSSLGSRASGADQTIKIGVILPLTGVAASSGQAIKAAFELGAKIVNEAHPELAPVTLAKATGGLPNLGGGKIELDIADSQGNPSVGQTQAVRLITEDHVVAILGSYQSSVTKTASAVAERYGIPFVGGDSVQADLTERGYKTFFRVTPAIGEFARAYVDFFNQLRKEGKSIKTIAVVHENTDYGTSVSAAMAAVVKGTPYEIVLDIPYTASTTDVSAEVIQLKEKKPDVVIFASYTSDSILYAQTMNNLGFKAQAIIGDDSGFVDGTFLKNVGNLMEGAMSRSSWAPPKPGTPTAKIAAMYKQLYNLDLNSYETAARDLQAFFVLADAINRAKSTDPNAIIGALRATNFPASVVILPYKGVKFDAKGQNIEGGVVIEQVHNSQYEVVWPAKYAEAKLEWPFIGKK